MTPTIGPAGFVFFGAYNPAYPRNDVLRRGLRKNGAVVTDCPASIHWRVWLRYPMLVLRFLGARRERREAEARAPRRYLFVPEFCAKDVPLAKLIGLVTARPVVFDPLAARYETKILDWRRKPPSSLTAWWNFRIDAAAFRLADVVLADTAAHKDYYCRTYGLAPDKVGVLYLGYDERAFRPVQAPAPVPGAAKPFRVLFFGSFLPLHGVEAAAEAAKMLAKEREIAFRFIGDGQTFPAVRAFVERHGLSNVELVGRVPLARLPEEIAAADICLGIFGRTEKARRVIPHKLMQAMALGKPVVTARTPAVEEVFTHRRDVYLCDEPLGPSLALAILELRRDETMRLALGEAGGRLVRDRFASPSIGRDLLALLRARVKGRG
jgi:glycosyltransferase involved in cell wall biosynthesis